ncbi:Transcriptional regulator containing GAF, AAA-type ATPase, and DNA-binding Fis domains [Desulfatibacillum alkenivorans DSM 16219]|uniref:Transcriptional regulator containing GAF, AAA-type ATPase, and DNA-binding Fis domains n=1 Tax=Desulfatibacillum alkenivorans DSM 16219 TaxID=1121393 RepID=A0A1M6T6Q5_9BACT|nr:sigma 54-interacting transcriptional regulator [Desulfatibacillum alkenivorans]SHK52594.1 Transcriptional regulator containing GAF, AAA-type ATPase, and DNA-binding Fis domains [Desulfatibacillum alkenivorans DSM 16219]
MDENKFFREATLRICGSIEIEKALFDCLDYLKNFIPAESVYLHFIDLREKTGVVYAMADGGGGRQLNIRFDYPAPVWRLIGDGSDLPEEVLLDRADKSTLGKHMLKIAGLSGIRSLMMMRLSLDSKEVGVIAFEARGESRFSREHLHRLRLLQSPFAVAISNSRRYIELLELKNLLADDNKYLQQELLSQKSDEIIGADFGLKHVMQQVNKVAPLSSPVLLMGETGVGKEVIANAIHKYSSRRNEPFIKVNCGAISETLIDSELFGHVRGAFTGAFENKRGRFERAHRGSIFLDEIGELPKAAQLRLLRVLQEMEFEPVGSAKTIKVDARVIAATNRNLEDMAAEGLFRKDLYFRLKVFPIYIPPLRERACDIPALTQYFMHKKYREMGFAEYPSLAPGAVKRLEAYEWPGNVRELENAVERAMIVSGGKTLHFDDSGFEKPRSVWEEAPRDAEGSPVMLDDVISSHIIKMLHRTKGKINGEDGAARAMGVNPATLRNKMRKLGVPFGRGVQYK